VRFVSTSSFLSPPLSSDSYAPCPLLPLPSRILELTASQRSALIQDTYKDKPVVEIYDWRRRPVLDHHRLRVPHIRARLEYGSFAILLGLFLLVQTSAFSAFSSLISSLHRSRQTPASQLPHPSDARCSLLDANASFRPQPTPPPTSTPSNSSSSSGPSVSPSTNGSESSKTVSPRTSGSRSTSSTRFTSLFSLRTLG
jgi:hypothetical protein